MEEKHESHHPCRTRVTNISEFCKNNISFVVAGDFGRHRCTAQVYPGAEDDSMLRDTCKTTCVLVYFSESLHIFAITEY